VKSALSLVFTRPTLPHKITRKRKQSNRHAHTYAGSTFGTFGNLVTLTFDFLTSQSTLAERLPRAVFLYKVCMVFKAFSF